MSYAVLAEHKDELAWSKTFSDFEKACAVYKEWIQARNALKQHKELLVVVHKRHVRVDR